MPNFTVEEKTILIKLVNKRKEIVESKYTDTKSIMKKKEAWMLIEKEFNSEINVYKVQMLFSYWYPREPIYHLLIVTTKYLFTA